jgi:methyl-accepting chemotaxis protein
MMPREMTIVARLWLAFCITFSLTLIVGGTGIWVSGRLGADAAAIYQRGAYGAEQLAVTKNALWELRYGVAQYLAIPTPESRAKIIAAGPVQFKSLQGGLDAFTQLDVPAETRAALEAVKSSFGEYRDKRPGWFELMEAGKIEEAAEYRARTILKSGAATVKNLEELIRVHTEDSLALSEESAKLVLSVQRLMLSVLALSLIMSIVIARWLMRAVIGPLGGEPAEAKNAVERIARGDLSARIKLLPGDERSLMAATAHMQASLIRMVSEMRHNAAELAESSTHMTTVASHVAATAQHQSEASGSMASAVREVTASIEHVSSSARSAHGVTSETESRAREGIEIIHQSADEMQRISVSVSSAADSLQSMGERSARISDIVRVIKDVADQTNLLALNAAIEAARAGEQGRGFAVVADEVRKLAERTAQATTEISSMIGGVQESAQGAIDIIVQAVERVEAGVGLSRQASESIEEIARGAHSVVESVTSISSALGEQSTASRHISANVERVAQMADENSAATREVSEAAGRLDGLAARTRAAIEKFSV